MDYWSLALNGALFICSGAGFVYGIVKFFKKNVALFNQLVVCALGCLMLGRLFNIVTLLTNNVISSGFTVGKLGFVGGFLFLFSASFGQMDGLVDGGEKEFRKYRIISLAAPLILAASYLIIFFGNSPKEEKTVVGIIILFLALCSYYNLKHLVIPDVDMGIIHSIRGYNLTALILTVLSAAELIVRNTGGKSAEVTVTVLLCFVYLAVIPVLEKGAKKWTI